jgi:hypothetical protein
VAAATWRVEYHVLVSPRDFEIDKLRREAAERNAEPLNQGAIPTIVLQRTWVSEGSSVTVNDGSCFIHVDSVSAYHVDLSIAVEAEQPKQFRDEASGTRLTMLTKAAVYYVDVHEIHEKQVGLEVTRQLISKPTQTN